MSPEKKVPSTNGEHNYNLITSWAIIYPLAVRNFCDFEIASITDFTRERVTKMISRPRTLMKLPDEYYSREYKAERKRRSKIQVRKTVSGVENEPRETNSINFARLVHKEGLIDNDGSIWREMGELYRSKQRELPENTFDRLRLEVFLKAKKAFVRDNDQSIIAKYIEIGQKINSTWFEVSLRSEENFIAENFLPSNNESGNIPRQVNEPEVLDKPKEDQTARPKKVKEVRRNPAPVTVDVDRSDPAYPLAIRGGSKTEISEVMTAQNPEKKGKEASHKSNSLAFARQLFKDGFFSEDLTFSEELQRILENQNGGAPKNFHYDLVLEAFILSKREDFEGRKGKLSRYAELGRKVDPVWFSSPGLSDDRKFILAKLTEGNNRIIVSNPESEEKFGEMEQFYRESGMEPD